MTVCVPASSVGGYTYARQCWACCQRARLLEGVLLYLPPLLVSGFIYFLFEVYIPVKGEVKAKIKISPVIVFGVLSRMVLVRES